jgi:TM2 domain-containing membrane protein YozV
VTGVELLRSRNQSSYVPYVKRQVSPVIATVLSLVCPGLGAAYNGQTSKGLVHFAVFAGLFQLATIGAMPLFVFGFIGMWLYAAVDAWRTARLIRSGLTPDGAEDWILQRFKGNPKVWGIVLTVIGAMFLLQRFLPMRSLMRAILPVLLIMLGIYLLREYVFKPKAKENDWTEFSTRADAPSFAAGSLGETNFRTGDYGAAVEDEFETQVRNWKSR